MTTQAERFWARVSKGDGCWEWTGWRSEKGYGHFHAHKEHGTNRAHRLAWIFTNGPVPAGMQVCHRCDNPPCVNPAHLFVGTNADNVTDMMRKGRKGTALGASNGQAKLAESDVVAIRASSLSAAALATRYGVTDHAIRLVRSRKRWAHVVSP